VPKLALDAMTPDGETMRDFADKVLDISAGGLTRRARLNSAGDNEGGFLDPLRDVVATGMTPADRLLYKYEHEWRGDVSKIYEEYSF
jgi:glutamate--cysteine ligase